MGILNKNLIHSIINFVFPPYCVGCKKEGAYVCARCLEGIARLPLSLLEHESLYSLYSYKNPLIQKSIFLAKYKHVFRALYGFAEPLAEIIFEIEKTGGAYMRPIMLVPIPSTKKSARNRGFSQTEVLANHIAELYPKEFTVAPILFRARKNKKQTECESRAERIHNMKEVFAIKPKAHVSARAAYVLIDDVITTGATMRAAQQTLTEGGARTVLGISIAYQELL